MRSDVVRALVVVRVTDPKGVKGSKGTKVKGSKGSKDKGSKGSKELKV